ncbi:MAG: hypothetical protein GY874_05670 [Desulfobacteraceae bacterium]|nr:hypothetical protein [Desulfobacteraceae bacterium]
MNLFRVIKQLVSISEGNTKLGPVANISLPPVKACKPDVPCADKDCYSLKAYKLRPTVKAAWDKNFQTAIESPDDYFDAIDRYLKARSYFRWHSSGDILNQGYLDSMIKTALNHSQIKFLAFTKRFEFDYSALPENLTVVFSMWPGVEVPDSALPTAWINDGIDERIPCDAFVCPGQCTECFYCWHMQNGQAVSFKKH